MKLFLNRHNPSGQPRNGPPVEPSYDSPAPDNTAPDHASRTADEPGHPDGIDGLGVPTSQSEREAFVITLAAVIALLGLCFTLGWIVFNHLQTGG